MHQEAVLSKTWHGKSRVRVAKVIRHRDGRQDIIELAIRVELEGGTEASFTQGDNRGVVATDTCRNNIYAHAKIEDFFNCEQFALGLSQRFLSLYPHVSNVLIYAEQTPWQRASLQGKSHAHGFVNVRHGTRKCYVKADRQSCLLTSSLDNLSVLKATQSGWSGFLRDKFTTLPETDERILATTISATWSYVSTKSSVEELRQMDFCDVHERVKQGLLETFFGPADGGIFSAGVQNTLYLMACHVLKCVPCVSDVCLSLPNLHFLPCDLPVLRNNGMYFNHDIYIPTDEPHGVITATVSRQKSRAKL